MPNELFEQRQKHQEIQITQEETVQKNQFDTPAPSIFAQLTHNETYDPQAKLKEYQTRMQGAQMPESILTTKTAPGKPVQKHRSSRKEEKARKEMLKKRMAAKAECPLANENSLMALNGLKEYQMHQKANQAAVDEFSKIHLSSQVEFVNLLSPFFKPCKLNKEGKPKSPKDRAIQKENAKLIFNWGALPEDFLDRSVDTLLKQELNAQMFTPQYLAHHAGELAKLDDQITSMQQMLKDYKQSYFDELPKEKVQALQKMVNLGPQLHRALSTSLGTMAVDYSAKSYITKNAEDQIRRAWRIRSDAINDLSNKLN